VDFVLITQDVNLLMDPINSEKTIKWIVSIKLKNVGPFLFKDIVIMETDATFYTNKKVSQLFLNLQWFLPNYKILAFSFYIRSLKILTYQNWAD